MTENPDSNIPVRKSLWARVLTRLSEIKAGIIDPFAPARGVDSVAFSISFIALSAKLAKADGQVTSDEVRMFRKIFLILPEDEASAAKVYDLCRQETSGFDTYARKMSKALGQGEDADGIRRDVLDGLFHIAMADGEYHPGEDEFLRVVADIFDIPDSEFSSMMARHVPMDKDPYLILGVEHDASDKDVREAWLKLVRENHPDVVTARGVPSEMIALAEARTASFNTAYDEIKALRSDFVHPDLL